MLAVIVICACLLVACVAKVRLEELSRRKWIAKYGVQIQEVARISPQTRLLTADHFYLYQPTLGSWIGQFAWWASVFLTSVWLMAWRDALEVA